MDNPDTKSGSAEGQRQGADPNVLKAGGLSIKLAEPNPNYQALIDHMNTRNNSPNAPGRFGLGLSSHTGYWERQGGATRLGRISWHNPEAEKLRDEMLTQLRGRIILDLGCGQNPENIQGTLKEYGPLGYLGVDIYANYGNKPYFEIPNFGIVIPQEESEEGRINGAIVRGDLLEVVSRLPDNTFSVTLNGIDNDIIPANSAYGEALVKEVARATIPGGLIFGVTFMGGILVSLSRMDGFSCQTLPLATDQKAIYFITKNTG